MLLGLFMESPVLSEMIIVYFCFVSLLNGYSNNLVFSLAHIFRYLFLLLLLV